MSIRTPAAITIGQNVACLAAMLSLLCLPASAQLFPTGPGIGQRYTPGGDAPRPPLSQRYDYGRNAGVGQNAAPRRYSERCVTSRGSCVLERPRPSGSACSCHIEGFGLKRGQVP